MKKLLNSCKFPLLSFFVWRILLFVFLIAAINIVPLQENYLGGGRQNYLSNPFLWSWANFDGEHYLSIARNGYSALQYFYFPALPMTVRFVSQLFGKDIETIVIIGIIVSNSSFLIGLIGFWKLLKLDFPINICRRIIIILLLFPTSFYFASFYTESLFFALVVWAFYFARSAKWFGSSVFGFFASLTRIIGITLFPSLVLEAFVQSKKKMKFKFGWLMLIPIGLICYMVYLKNATGDPLEFFNSVSVFGQQRSSTFILPPRVIYRYVFKILPNINYSFFPLVYTTIMEFVVGVGFLVLCVYSFLKLRLSYSSYLLLGYLLPVFSGSFSSMPRYIVVLFPGFILLEILIGKLPKILQLTVFGLLFTSLGVTFALFSRGFWVS